MDSLTKEWRAGSGVSVVLLFTGRTGQKGASWTCLGMDLRTFLQRQSNQTRKWLRAWMPGKFVSGIWKYEIFVVWMMG